MHTSIDEYLRNFEGQLTYICSKHTQKPPEGAYQVNFSRLELVISGQYTVLVPKEHENKKINILSSEMFFVPNQTWYIPTWKNDCHLLSILFGKSQIGFSSVKYIKNKGFSDIQKHSITVTNPLVIEKMLDVLSFLKDPDEWVLIGDHLAKAIIHFCKSSFLKPEPLNITRSEKLYKDMCIYINENYYRNITRDDLSKKFNISNSHISRIFQQTGNTKFSDYVNHIRLEKAKKLLLSHNYRIEDISHRCGFKDINYFCRVFKKNTKQTPSQFRLNWK